MKTARAFMGKSPLNHGIKITLAAFIILVTVGCQSQKKVREHQLLLQKNMDNNTEKIISQINALQENQQSINESVKKIITDQLTIATKVAGTQRQLASQITETTEIIHQEQAELKTTVQNENAQLVQQVQALTDRQQHLEKATETIHANGQTLCTSHDQVLAQLTELKEGYQHWQDQLKLMQEKTAALDASVGAMRVDLGEFKSAVTRDIKGLAENQASEQAVEQDIKQQLTAINHMLTGAGTLQRNLLALLQDIDQTTRMQGEKYMDVIEFLQQQDDQASVSLPDQMDAKLEPSTEPIKSP